MTEQPSRATMTCPTCGGADFNLLSDGTVLCARDSCLALYAKLAPALVRVPGAKRRLGLARGESPNPLHRHEENWYFTFGIEHPLRGYVVRLRGTIEGTREQMIIIFGTNWARQYDQREAMPIIENRDLTELEIK